MADDVPVCDVLIEAMEYLVKLGSNLRTRSESLKVKRIRRDKLKNAHAVQKAANKVLMICELSKKSLDNVESGVKRVLRIVDNSQAAIYVGGNPDKGSPGAKSKTFDRQQSLEKKDYQYFRYRSTKLKIRKKVPVKHFMSVKVLAKELPKSMQDKYPVYYDCKLYRMRKRKALKEHERREILESMKSSNTNSTSDIVKDKDENCRKTSKKQNDSEVEDDVKKSDSESEKINKEIKQSSDKAKTDAETKKRQKECKKSLLEDSESENELQETEESVQRKEKTSDFIRKKKVKRREKKSDSSSEHSKSDSEELKKSACVRKYRRKSTVITSDSEDETKKYHEHSSEKSDKKTFNEDSNSKTKRKKEEKETEKISPSKRNKRILSTDSETSQKESDKESREINEVPEDKPQEVDSDKDNQHSNSEKENELKEKNGKTGRSRRARSVEDSDSEDILSKNNEENNSKKDVVDLASDDEKSEPEKQDKTEPQGKKEEENKPLIKCVSLTKLLKPDIIPIVMSTSEKQKQDKQSVIKNSSKNSVKAKKTVRYQDEEEFWSQKRAEVKAFKSKEFAIRIARLPLSNVNLFLKTHNIKRISQGGKVIHEIKSENEESKINSTVSGDSQDKNKDSPIEWPDITKIKTALLIDSDSDEELNKENDRKSEPNNAKSKERESVNNKEKESINDKDPEKSDELQSEKRFVDLLSKDQKKSSDDLHPNKSKNKSDDLQSTNNVEGSLKSSNKDENDSCQLETEKYLADKDQEANTGKSPEKEITPLQEDDTEAVKSSLLNHSSNSSPTPTSPMHKKKKLSESPTKLKRKRIMESMKAKKMLLTHSSSSETEDESLKKEFKKIKEALLKEESSEDESSKLDKTSEDKKSSDSEDNAKKKRSHAQLSSDSGDDILRKVKKKRKMRRTSRRSKTKSRSPSPAKTDAENGNSGEEGDNVSMDSTINQVDGTIDEQSNSSNSKMGRSNEKPGSSQNSDAQDDKDIDGLTNLKSLGKSRRRRDSDDAGGSGNTRKSRMPRATPLIQGESGLLEAPMTDDESGAESEGGVEEDLPPVTLSGLNGAGIGELAKDDLLGESDSSSSNDKEQHSEDNAKKEESSSEDQIKLKRRKLAISSDSEAGSSRRKRNDDADARISDFEDSETEGSEPVKKTKKKKKVDSDEGSDGSSSEAGKKKRRRIKQIDDSDGSGSDSDIDGKNKHGRKNIRKVMGKNQLEEATKKAARQEKERIARIAERQKLYNNLEFDESGKPDEVVLDKVVLDFDPETKEPLIEVDRGLVKKLKPHQANGIKFMWDACFESVKRIKKDKGSGCILAHCMGLGKTLQVVTLTHTLLAHAALTRVARVLVVCPLSTVLNWVNEFRMWLKHARAPCEVDVYELSRYKQNSERAFQLSQWYNHGGVCVLGYEMFRNLSADNPKKYKKKMLKTFQEALVDPGPDMVVCDEGHLLKNEKTSLSQSMNRVRTLRRIVLTGTPLQNNLKEYYCMVQFVKPNLLGKYNEYLNRFVNPITNGQYTDSTEHDIRVMKRRSHVLHKMLDGAVQRRDYGVLAPFLPPKHEYVLFITLSEVQVKLYQHYLENYSRRPLPGKSSGFLFPDFQSLQRIWTHPLVLKYNSERYELMQQKKRDKEEEDSEGSLVDFIDDDSTPEESSTEESSDDLSDLSDDSRKKSKKKKDKKSKAKETAASRRRGTRANPGTMEMEEEEVKDLDQIEGKNDNPTEWWIPLVDDDVLEDIRNSHKLMLLLEILRQCEAIGDKLLVFSQSLYSLDLIEHFLGKIDEATQEGRVDDKLGGHVGSWSPGIDYFRLDGSTSCENRSIWCKNFNREDNPRARLFLISTRAGGLGINLVAANRVVIFDVSWNPSHDVQSIFRVYRFGQKKPCYVYRFLAMGTMEEKIYERQVTKQAISKRVIDEQQIDRHYAENDLAELYKFEPTPPVPRPVPLVPKDRLFAEMLKQHENCIYKFHEHDSLLENKEEETLTEEERKAAWDDFENEKNRPPPVPFANMWPQHNGMAGLLAQQQTQLAFAALAAMLRKDMPGLTEDQIRGMLPLIYSSNPSLMQKLNDIYKYPNPAMMNPAMMNSVMNPAAGAASGLQYEPPWAREQQQQQQMRLQQLMQHQNQMGAKYYAGGLGSRDPVAMALQQQRAREIMLERGGAGAMGGAVGGAGGRPRGRPPLQPRAPPPGDVVTLDSD